MKYNLVELVSGKHVKSFNVTDFGLRDMMYEERDALQKLALDSGMNLNQVRYAVQPGD